MDDNIAIKKIMSYMSGKPISGIGNLKADDEWFVFRYDDKVLTTISIVPALVLGEVWDKKYVNNLPDMAFAIVTTLKKVKIRKLPHHNKGVKSAAENDSVDLSHLRNALARVTQVKGVPAHLVAKAKIHLERHAKILLKKE
jgi:hypothetical protein